MSSIETIIVGAGPAGCLLARDLARRGHRVVLLDARARDALGHDWWDTVEASLFPRCGLAPPRRPLLTAPYRFALRSPWGSTKLTAVMPPTHVNVDRRVLAERLLDAALEAGAEFRGETPVRGALVERGAVVGVGLVGGEELRASAVVDAGGATGVLRRTIPPALAVGFSAEVAQEDFVRTYREIRADTSQGGRSLISIDEEGPSWVSRAEDGLVEVFSCVLGRPGARDPRERVDGLVRTEGGMGRTVVRGGQYGLIPVRRAFDSFVAPGFLMVGDAACMANPLNGSGVTNAMLAAQIAARTLHEALAGGRVGVAALWPYNAEYKRRFDGRFAKLHLLRLFLLHEPALEESAYALFESGLVAPNSFWTLEEELAPARLIAKLPLALRQTQHAGLLWRLGGVLVQARRLEAHYARYPSAWDPQAFAAWCAGRAQIFEGLSLAA